MRGIFLNSKNVFRAVAVIMCTIIGAGFASGKEIYNFFARFGEYGKFGIVLSGVITGGIIHFSLKIAHKNNIKNNSDFIATIKAPHILYNIVNIFLLISFYIMIAGFSGFFKQEFNIPVYLTSGTLSIFLYFVLINKIEGIVKLNSVIAPILIFILVYVGIKYGVKDVNAITEKSNFLKAIFNSVLYASYNSIVLVPILVTLKKYIKTKRTAGQVSIITAVLIIVLSFGIYGALIKGGANTARLELPMISIINNKLEKHVYSVAIEAAIFTSAISAGYGVLENLSEGTKNNRKKYKIIVAFMCLLGIPISGLGFGKLVKTMYPLFGMLNLLQLLLILKRARET